MIFFKADSRLAHYLMIVVVAMLVLLPGNATLPLIDRDEPRFTQATREMVQKGEWAIPYFNGEYRFDKPVMTYWLMRGSFAVFGDNEFAARFASVVCSLLVALLIYEFGCRHFSIRAGLMAAGGWLTCLQVLLHGRLAVADMPMVFAVTLCHMAMYELLYGEAWRRTKWFWVFYGALAFGFLSKGPIAILCPLFTLLLFRLVFWRKPIAWRPLRLISGTAVVLILVSLWGIPALMKTHGLFWKVGMNEHVVQRGLETFNNRFFLPFYYLPTALLSLFPWIAFAGVAWGYLRKNWNQENAFLVFWLVGPYIIFSLYATQLPHYVLPAFPAIFLILGQSVSERWKKERKISSPFIWVEIAIGVVLAGLLFGLGMGESFSPESLPLKKVLYSISILLLALSFTALCIRRRSKFTTWVSLVFVSVALFSLGTNVRKLSIGVELKHALGNLPSGSENVFHGFEEPSIVYYSNAKWKIGQVDAESIEKPGARAFLLLKREVRLEDYCAMKFPQWIKQKQREPSVLTDALRESLRAAGYKSASADGLNLARISWVETELWYRN